MARDAEARLGDLSERNEAAGPLFKMRDDPRVTRTGAFLRRYSLDELPQLVNVLTGTMSLVGPRPPLPSEVATYDERTARRLVVKPGLTGLWQIQGRSDLPWDEGVYLDVMYVDHWSPLLDLVILARTARAVLRPRGAY
jgi:lipopolysaccharide/colanic/teichoic acid biosynthesis glycosyltransferase